MDINLDKLQQLLNFGFSVKQIAEDGLLGGVLHSNTLYKTLKENNMQIRSSYSDISEEDLQKLVAEYNRYHSNAGKFCNLSYI